MNRLLLSLTLCLSTAVSFGSDSTHSDATASASHETSPTASHDSHSENHSASTGAHGEHGEATSPALAAHKKAESLGMLNLARRYMDRANYSGAETALLHILNNEKDPDLKAKALLAYADFLNKTGKPERAAATYEKFLDLNSDHPLVPSVQFSLAKILRQLHAHDRALNRFYAVLNSTTQITADGVEEYRSLTQAAKFEIAETYFQLGDYKNAEKFFARVKVLDLPVADQARATFREAYSAERNGAREAAVEKLSAYIEKYPDDESVQEARYLLCINLRALNRVQDALRETLALLKVEKSQSQLNAKRWEYWQRKTGNQLANDFYVVGDYESAVVIYLAIAGLSSSPDWRWPALYQAGLCFERQRLSRRAAEIYHLLLKEADAAEKATPAVPFDKEIPRQVAWRLAQIDWDELVDLKISSVARRTGNQPPKAVAQNNPE